MRVFLLLTTSSAFVVLSPARHHRCHRQHQQVILQPRGSKEYYEGMVKSGLSAEDSKKDMLTPTLKLAGGASAVLVGLLALFVAANLDVPPAVSAASTATFEPRGITLVDGVVFVVGTVPFLWAANEFWRRIAVGDSFGTGSDSIVIDPAADADQDQLRRFGGRRVLGQDAIIAARLLMTVAAGSVALTAIAAFQL